MYSVGMIAVLLGICRGTVGNCY